MKTTLRSFLRSKFCSRVEAAFLKLFERDKTLCRAILLEQTSPLSGIVTTYLWREFPERSHLGIYEVNLKNKARRAIDERDLPKTEIADVFRCIEEAGGVELGNFSGRVKDGVFYGLCWGDSSNQTSLSIKNPQFGSERHQKLVTMLRKRAIETAQ